MLWAIPSVFALRQIKKSEKTDVISFHDLIHKKYTFTLYDITRYLSLIKAIDSVGDPPLPIPNREVKPDSADGTANVCGRVGHRHFYRKGHLRMSFFCYIKLSMSSSRGGGALVAPHAV